MKIEQIANIVNESFEQWTGQQNVFDKDLSAAIDFGESLEDLDSVNKFVKGLVDRIGKVIFVDRPYTGRAPKLMRDDVEWGSIIMKICSDFPNATVNESFNLVDGASYDPNVYKSPDAEAKFFNKMVVFEIDPPSIPDYQIRSAFTSPAQMNSFVNMLFNNTEKAMTVRTDSLIMDVISSAIAATLHNAFPSSTYTGVGNARCINLLRRYNDHFGTSLTVDSCYTDPAFIRWAGFQMKLVVDRIKYMSTLFNIGGKKRHTPESLMHFILLSEFESAADTYLQSDVWHNTFTKLPNAETVPFWQGSGEDYSFGQTSKIDITIPDGSTRVTTYGILGTIFDRDAMGVNLFTRNITANHNPVGEFTNYWYKQRARYFVDTNENIVVFYVA